MSADEMFKNFDQFENLKNLLDDEELIDCKFIFDNKTDVSANRLILANASSVFRAMFYGKMKEDTIHINDISSDCFKVCLHKHLCKYFVSF